MLKTNSELRSPYRAIKRCGKTQRVHRFLMEEHLGRTLRRFEAVHHKNGNKLDNSISNLEVLSFGDHARLHNSRIKPRPCAICGKDFKPFTDARTKYITCSIKCGAEYRAHIPFSGMIEIERQIANGEDLNKILSALGVTRRTYKQRRRMLSRAGRLPKAT